MQTMILGDLPIALESVRPHCRLPVAADMAVLQNDRIENIRPVRPMTVGRIKNYITALVAYKIFVIRRQQHEIPLAEAPCPS